MGISYAQLVKHLRPTGNWTGLQNLTYTPRLLTVPQALGCLNAWSLGKETVRDYVKRVGASTLPPKVQAYANNFDDGPVYLIAFSLDTLGLLWADKYPGARGTDLVIWDGHHRSSALAIREARGIADDHPVFVFVGA